MTAQKMLAELLHLQEAGKVLSAANVALVQQIHDASKNLPAGVQASQIQSLAKNLLGQTSTGGTDTRDAGQNDAKTAPRGGPTLQSYKGELDHDNDLDDGAMADQSSHVSFGKGTNATYPKGGTDDSAPAVNSAGDKGDNSGHFREADDKHQDANTNIEPKLPLNKKTKPEALVDRKEDASDNGSSQGGDNFTTGDKNRLSVKSKDKPTKLNKGGQPVMNMQEAADEFEGDIVSRVMETMAFNSQDSYGREKLIDGQTGPDARGIDANEEDVQKTLKGEQKFDDPSKEKDENFHKGFGDVSAKPIHLTQEEASAVREAKGDDEDAMTQKGGVHVDIGSHMEDGDDEDDGKMKEAVREGRELAEMVILYETAGRYLSKKDRRLVEKVLKAKARKALPSEDFALPGKGEGPEGKGSGSYPIPDEGHAKAALGRAKANATPAEQATIKRKVKAKFPDMKVAEAQSAGADQMQKEEDDFEEAAHGTEVFAEDAQILEAVGAEGKEWDVLLIEAGWSKNGNYYPPEMLRNAVPLFEGVSSFTDHSTELERRQRPERSIKDKVGWFTNPRYTAVQVGNRMTEGIVARFHCVDTDVRSKLKEAVAMGRPDFIGFSIDATGRVQKRNLGGRPGNFVEALNRVHSVDLVTDPAAGGQLMRLVAANRPTNTEEINVDTDTLVKEAVQKAVHETLAAVRGDLTGPRVDRILTDVKLSPAGKDHIREAFVEMANRRDFTDEEVMQEASRLQAYEAAVLANTQSIPSRFRDGSDRNGERVVESMVDQREKFDLALMGMFGEGTQVKTYKDKNGNPVKPFRSLKEAYCYWTGTNPLDLNVDDMHDAFFTNYNSRKDHSRIRESLTTASWGSIYADHLYLKLMRDYNMLPYTTMWQQVCSEIEDVPDFQTRHWDRVGGYSDLPVVSEQGTYPTLTSPTNEEVTYSISKKGGLDDVTFESIVNDRVGSIRRIPTHMARAAARTLFKTVMNTVTTTNPTMGYDSVALYNTAHNNQLNSGSGLALSLNSVDALIQAMRNQTAYGESQEILGPRNLPRTLIVDNKLEQRAKRIVNPSDHYLIHDTADTATNIDPASFVSYGMNVLVYDQLAGASGLDGSTPHWYAVADPQQVETLVVGFLNGQQEPEMFVQDQPNVGSVFTADKITYKIRHIYGLVVLDHRSFVQGN